MATPVRSTLWIQLQLFEYMGMFILLPETNFYSADIATNAEFMQRIWLLIEPSSYYID